MCSSPNVDMRKTFNLTYACGIHARPSASLVSLVKKFDAKVHVIKDSQKANARSILEVLSMGIQPGEVTFESEGKDAEEVMEEIEKFIHILSTEHHW
jgi:phosphotransferase system HPr (HPr) family protein